MSKDIVYRCDFEGCERDAEWRLGVRQLTSHRRLWNGDPPEADWDRISDLCPDHVNALSSNGAGTWKLAYRAVAEAGG